MIKILKWFTHTKLGWFVISFIWAATFTVIDSNIQEDWAFWTSIPAFAYMIVLTLTMLVYAWIINPIRERKRNKIEQINRKNK